METRDDVHEPVMLGRVVELLSPALTSPGAVYVDCTLGLGGHARRSWRSLPRRGSSASTATRMPWPWPGNDSVPWRNGPLS